MELTLVVLAAGMGSRYGGLKQLDPVGPAGEIILDYSVDAAMRAGFSKVVFVIRRDMLQFFRETVGARYESRLAVEYVFQEVDSTRPHQAVGHRSRRIVGIFRRKWTLCRDQCGRLLR